MMVRGGSLVQWFREQELLRGPFLFVDYWANVLGLEGVIPQEQIERGFIDPPLFRFGIDRPDLEVPRTWSYFFLSLFGPFLFAFRSFRHLGRYRLRFAGRRAAAVQQELARYRLRLDPASAPPGLAGGPGPGPRCDVRLGDTVLARDLLDPYRVAGFSSLFWAANKLPLASFAGFLVVGVAAPLLAATHLLNVTAHYWIPLGFPLLVVLLRAVFREWATAIFGALPILIGTALVGVLNPSTPTDWSVFFWALAGIWVLYLLADAFFLPRPVPPALLLYTRTGPGRPYTRSEDEPWWLEGEAYWVWRYLLLSPAEVNKFWERDWERVDLWIRADGPDAGRLEWVVTDLHYRELWMPYHKLADPETLEQQRREAAIAAAGEAAGIWLVEVDADLIFHSPVFRAVTFLTDRGGVPVRGITHVLRSLWRRVRDDDIAGPMREIHRIRMEEGVDVLGDIPEIFSRQAEQRIVAEPWTYWRYPLGAARARTPRVYERSRTFEATAAADPALQIKSPEKEAI